MTQRMSSKVQSSFQEPLACQRTLFDIDDGICYLDSAAMSPLPKRVLQAGETGVIEKTKPWLRNRLATTERIERARTLGGALIGAEADNVAIISSVSYGIATACANVPVAPGSRMLLLEGDHTSQTLSWIRVAHERSATVEIVAQPCDGDWKTAILERTFRSPASPVSVAALCPVAWTDGTLVDLESVVPVLRAAGVAVVIDATQSAGVLPLDVRRLDPDFVVFPTYKWLLGPYSIAFLYAAPRHYSGRPLEQNVNSRQVFDPTCTAGAEEFSYLDGARRFYMGERDSYFGIPAAIAGLELVQTWGEARLAERLGRLTGRLADALFAGGLEVASPTRRSPHILGIRGLGVKAFERCRANDIYISMRRGVIRVSPHAYNDEADVDRCAETLLESCS